MKRYSFFFVFLLFFVVFSTIFSISYAETSPFYRNLGVGSVGSDVHQLQQFLNSSSDTTIALTGPGSSGNETSKFGTLTKNAVIQFQQKNGLPQTGYVGPLTLQKLNNMVMNTNASPSVSDPLSQYKIKDTEKIDIYQTDKQIQALQDNITAKINVAITSPTPSATPILNTQDFSFNPSVYLSAGGTHQGNPGDTIILAGFGFDSHSSIYFGTDYIVRTTQFSDGILSFIVPALPAGRYNIVVKNAQGVSNSTYFVVTSSLYASPALVSVSPSSVVYGSTMTLSGKGFTHDNDIYTTFGIIKNISSLDGKTLTILFSPDYLKLIAKTAPSGSNYDGVVSVVNDYGTSQFVSFTLSL